MFTAGLAWPGWWSGRGCQVLIAGIVVEMEGRCEECRLGGLECELYCAVVYSTVCTGVFVLAA